MRMGARYGGLNPVTAAGLWRRIGIPRMIYGCELWQLNRHDILELEKSTEYYGAYHARFSARYFWIYFSWTYRFVDN